ncbi:M3 family oligoendopeptidase [Alicyclobacillus kakegawensis]|uniref:M3 family oligoendopeptidase n=1 Tax=Alicyclobacillus kakegawensis TaxID=392012 RepID=UPI00082B46C1|nr:M3 family oligoendopeptidase [Alicyclobacillus kakegawensis]
MENSWNPTWDLDVIFPGGSNSVLFNQFLDALVADLRDLLSRARQLTPQTDAEGWLAFLDPFTDASKRLSEAEAYVSCLTAQDVHDEQAKLLEARVNQAAAVHESVSTVYEQVLGRIPEDTWQRLLRHERLAGVAFPLSEARARAARKLPAEQEVLISDLAVDGYHAWGNFYYSLIGQTLIPYEEDGRTVHLSVGQANNKLRDGQRRVREQVFTNFERAFQEKEELYAQTLNHLAGYRLAVYRARGWDSVLAEPLDYNRMRPETLDAMWAAIVDNKDVFVQALSAKAKLLGLSQLSWHDVDAPVGSEDKVFSPDEARDFVVDHFARFSPDMAAFARSCFDKRWIEAEDRPGKRPGGFCTSFPVSEQTRIFMTFSGTADNVSTLAHELGHAYHQHVMRGVPYLASRYAMNVAETASTFAEAIVVDAALAAATDAQAKLAMLDAKVTQSVAMFMNIHARFLFETRFYERRRQGMVSAAELNELMEAAQREAYCGTLGQYHPRFWAAKLHFYITEVPFYNFPYTFGYLFSTGIYARAQQEGPGFAAKYVDLLRDTGRLSTEDLAAKHLGVDLTKPDFWQQALQQLKADALAFIAAADAAS